MNTYVRPRRTFSTVDVDREALGQADTVSTRRPVHTERLKRLPRLRLAAVLPSIRRLTTMFLPRLQSLETIRRPVDRAAAVPIETAYMKVRIRKNLHAEMCLDFIFYITLGTGFWTSRFSLSMTLRRGYRGAGLKIFTTAFNHLKREHTAQRRPSPRRTTPIGNAILKVSEEPGRCESAGRNPERRPRPARAR